MGADHDTDLDQTRYARGRSEPSDRSKAAHSGNDWRGDRCEATYDRQYVEAGLEIPFKGSLVEPREDICETRHCAVDREGEEHDFGLQRQKAKGDHQRGDDEGGKLFYQQAAVRVKLECAPFYWQRASKIFREEHRIQRKSNRTVWIGSLVRELREHSVERFGRCSRAVS